MATAQTKPPENAMLSEEAQLAQKYGGAIKKPGMNNILQKRLNKGQKYFDSGDYNMAKAKTPGVPKAAQASTQPGVPAGAEQPQVEEPQSPPSTAEPVAATEASEKQVSAVSEPAEPAAPPESTAEAAEKTENAENADEQQRSYPRKAVPAASPLSKPPTPNAAGVPAPEGAPVGGIPHPRALTVHLAHPTHTGPFVTHPERSSPSTETAPVALGADAERRTSASHSHDAQAEQH